MRSIFIKTATRWLLPAASPLLIFLFSCSHFQDPEFRGVSAIDLSRFGLNESTLSLKLDFYNPNNTSIKLKSATGEVWLNGNSQGHFLVDSLIRIPAKGPFSLPVKLKLGMNGIIGNTMVILGNKEVPVRIEGTARVGKGGIYFRYPIRYEGMQKPGDWLK